MRFGIVLALTAALAAGCSDSGTSPSDTSAVVIGSPRPDSSSSGTPIITATNGIIPRGSGQITIPITVTSGRDWPWAQLNVYLLSADGYCAQNMPDAPTWGPLPKGHRQELTVSGFQVFRDTCNVTGIRVMLHQRNNGLLTPPTASETLAEATRPVSWTLVR